MENIIEQHIGGTNPTTEGWSVISGSYQAQGPQNNIYGIPSYKLYTGSSSTNMIRNQFPAQSGNNWFFEATFFVNFVHTLALDVGDIRLEFYFKSNSGPYAQFNGLQSGVVNLPNFPQVELGNNYYTKLMVANNAGASTVDIWTERVIGTSSSTTEVNTTHVGTYAHSEFGAGLNTVGRIEIYSGAFDAWWMGDTTLYDNWI